MEEGPAALGDVFEDPIDALVQLRVGKSVAIGRRQMQKLNACRRQRLGIVLRFRSAIDDGGHPVVFESFDLPRPEGSADRELRRDVRIVQLLGLKIGQPLHEPREYAQPDSTQWPAKS